MSAIAPTRTPVFDVDAAGFESGVLQTSHRVPVLVDFWAAWCGPCKALAPVLEKLAHEAPADGAGAFVLAKVDTDASQSLAASMGIRSLPTVRLFVDGAPVAEFMGAQPESAVRAFLARHLPRPVNSGAALAVETALDAGDREAARDALDALDTATRESPRVTALDARLWILDRAAAEDETPSSSDADVQARFGAALRLAAQQRHEDALEALLALISRDRNVARGGARECMLKIFEVLGSDDPRVTTWRGRLASALN